MLVGLGFGLAAGQRVGWFRAWGGWLVWGASMLVGLEFQLAACQHVGWFAV